MQRTLLVSIFVVAACGGGAQPETRDVTMPTVSASATVAPPPRATGPLGLPHGAPLVAAFQMDAVFGLIGGARVELEHELGLPDGALAGNLATLGVDAKRPVTVAIAPLGAAEEKLVDDVAALAAQPTPSAGNAAIDRFRAGHVAMGMRVLVPATDPAKLESTLETLLAKEQWRVVPNGLVNGRMVAKLSKDASWVAIDLGAGDADAAVTLAALARDFASARDDAPSLDGDAVRVAWSPPDVARIGFLSGLTKAVGAVSGESVDPSQRARIMAEALKEASAGFALMGTKAKPVFERVEARARVTPFEVTLRAKPGAGLAMPDDAAWAPSSSLTIAGAEAEVSESRAWLEAWSLPSQPMTLMRDAGELSLLGALPQLLLAAPIEIPRLARAARPPQEVAGRFERIGEAWNATGDETWFGFLPPKTSRAEATCALSPTTRCAASAKLPLNKAQRNPHGYAKLVEVDHRFVLLLAKEAAPLAATPKTRPATGPLHFEASTKVLVGALGTTLPLPARVVGDVSRDGGAIVFRLTAP